MTAISGAMTRLRKSQVLNSSRLRCASSGTAITTSPSAGLRLSLICRSHRRHVGQPVRDALVTVDARLLAAIEGGRMLVGGAFRLACEIHRLELMAVAALERIVCLEPGPFTLRELEPLVEKLFARI